MKENKFALLALASIPLMMTLGNSMFIPVLPVIEREIDITAFQSSLIITIYSIIAIVLIPIAGYLSDHFGRKKIIIPSLILVGIGGIVCGWASISSDNPYSWILFGRFLQGAGAAGAFPVVIPTVGDLFEKEEEVSAGLGLIETSNTFGKVLSPVLGAALAIWVWYIPFWSVPLFSAIAVILMLVFVKAPREENEPLPFNAFLKTIKQSFKKNGHWLYGVFMIGGINMFVVFGFLIYLSSSLEAKFGITGVLKGVYLAIPLLALCIASYLTGKMIGKDNRIMDRLIFVGNLVSTIALFILLFTNSLLMIILFLSVSGLGIGVVLPCLDALITEDIEKEERGTITSFYSSMRFIGVAAGPPVISLLLKSSDKLVFITLASVSVLAIAITLYALIRKTATVRQT
ncbi:MFS transporter [Pseudalkalibacillus salsuginis]|uniref:MFS transporter n=1 Tax=Pseudalkalibacillus salsuginis TaxID=2910972 RepID=UPI001F3A4066|nr:MFS transporter [Pseudalkalibacillus salsuginis]MCF6411662.1 MFS transporter [Pseudalkalibacillus salsuginis]